MKTKFRFLLLTLVFSFAILFNKTDAQAKKLDEILTYSIIAEVNDDATVTLTYHIDWKVLDSSSEGPLEWVKIGIPNNKYKSYRALSNTISKIAPLSSGGSWMRIDFDRKYYKDEVVSFDFEVVQDYIYQMNYSNEGETVYQFTAGWFDNIDVDNFAILWKADKALTWYPQAEVNNGYIMWLSSLSPSEKFNVEVTYPNDAYNFDVSKNMKDSSHSNTSYDDDDTDASDVLAGLFCLCVGMYVIIAPIVAISKGIKNYASGGTFGDVDKKYTRTKIVYYPTCEGCGGTREEGKDVCAYCGRSMIKSKEVITEDALKKEEKEAGKFKKNGTFHYSSDPYTYVHVHVTHVPRPKPSCAHSSCACASHCACACACACAGGGRAGCTNKDFYNTNLKLEQLEKKAKYKK